MASVKVTVPSSIKRKVKKDMEKLLKDPRLLNEVKRFSVNRIIQMARLQKSMHGSKSSRTLPKLSKSYIKQRKARTKETDSEFFKKNATRSNWTLTGQFLKSIKGIIIRTKKFQGAVAIFPTGRRKDGNKNIEILRWLTTLNKRYEIFSINKAGQKEIRKITVRFLRRKIKNKIK